MKEEEEEEERKKDSFIIWLSYNMASILPSYLLLILPSKALYLYTFWRAKCQKIRSYEFKGRYVS
jgi:hypothetical protein